MSDKRLLVLDDDPLTGQTIKSIAEFSGLEVRFTTRPDDFFRLVGDWQPGYIAIDLIMPDMDGVEVMKSLAEQGCQARIIITSGVGSRVLDAASRSAAEHGLNIIGILAKPFSPAELRSLLTRAAPKPPADAREDRASYEEGLTAEDLSQAIDRGAFHLAYQPKIDCRTGVLTGFEALARWLDDTQGAIAPDRFIAVAERTGLIDRLTEHLVGQALEWFAAFRASPDQASNASHRALSELTLSLNISARSLGNFELFEQIEAHCRRLALAPDRLILELTETSAMEDPTTSLDTLTRLRVRGFHLSIDDFGTGFSSMLQLVRLPFSEIKIDKSFIMTATESAESRTVVKSIVDLGHSLGLSVTAEGIEDEATLEYLRTIGCDRAQGYHLGRPMAASAIVAWLGDYATHTEQRRLDTLYQLDILDTPYEERFDRITRLAQRLFEVPYALISLVDRHRQWFKSHPGFTVRETPRSESFCTHAIEEQQTLVIEDSQRDPRTAGLPLVLGEPYIRFYAGCPLRASNGANLGTLCILDSQVRQLSDEEHQLLADLGEMAEQELLSEERNSTDHLTGLCNRPGFESRAETALRLCQHLGLPAYLWFIDLDQFQRINDAFGHAEGDTALVHFGQLLRESVRESDLVGRYAGDQFVVLMADAPADSARAVIDRLGDHLNRFNGEAGRAYSLSFSYGGAPAGTDEGYRLEQLVSRADQAMYDAKP